MYNTEGFFPSFFFAQTTMTREQTQRSLPIFLSLVLAAALLSGCSGGKSGSDASSGAPDSEEAKQEPHYHGLMEEYRSVLAEDPHNLAAIIALGNALYDAGQWREAIHYYEQALRLSPHNADVITDMGTCYRNLALPDMAIREYKKALQIDASHQNALYNLGLVYGHDKHDYLRSIAAWERLLEVAPKHPEHETLRASIKTYKQAVKKARQ